MDRKAWRAAILGVTKSRTWLSDWTERNCWSMSSSNCYFLTCILFSQEPSQVVWYSHLFQNFPWFIVIHTVEGFGIVSNVFLVLSCFFCNPANVGNLISGSSAFSKTSLNIWSSRFTYCWSLASEFWALLYQPVRWVQLCSSLNILWHWFLWDWNENWPFPVLWPLLRFPNLLTYWV